MYIYSTKIGNAWDIAVLGDVQGQGPWIEAIDLVNRFQEEANAVIRKYNKEQPDDKYHVNYFDVTSDSRDLNEEMDMVFLDIRRLEARGASKFPMNRLKVIIEKFSIKLLKLSLHLMNASIWRFDKMVPILDMFYRYDVNGSKIERSPNNFRGIFLGKHYFGYYVKVSYYSIHVYSVAYIRKLHMYLRISISFILCSFILCLYAQCVCV